MSGEVSSLVVGFLLTSVAGGFVGYLFQKRRWDADRRETERREAAATFGDVARLMDRRLYRMWKLHWALLGRGDRNGAMADYRHVLEDWNENLNRNLALVRRYFGHSAWTFLDFTLYEEFKRLGEVLEEAYRIAGTPNREGVARELKLLSDRVYEVRQVADFDGPAG